MNNHFPKIVVFGDCLVESSVHHDVNGFALQVIETYLNRADIVVRGFGGYNTSEIYPLCRSIIALKPQTVLLGLGNSDSSLESQFQHVPLDSFTKNLETITSDLAAHGAWPILITPTAPNEARIRSRSLAHTAAYALACRRVAEQMRIEIIDIFHAMQLFCNWETEMLLRDGFSLSRKGHELLARMAIQKLQVVLPSKESPRLHPVSV